MVPFLKVDQGLEAEQDGVRMMKPIADLRASMESAKAHGMFGTKMRSVIRAANWDGISAVVAQQFRLANVIADAGLLPILR